MRVAIYHLVLPIDKTEETEKSLNQLRGFAKSKGWVGTEYIDRMFFGKESRPQFTCLQKDLKAGKFQAVVCISLDRWAADLKQIVALAEIKDKGIEFISLDGIDISFVGVIRSVLKTLKKTKIRVSMAQAKAIGIEIGRRPTPPDQVARVIETYLQDESQSVRVIGKSVGLPKSSIFRILQQFRNGNIDKNGMPVASKC